MTQGIDSTSGELMQGFKLPDNGKTEIVVSATGAVVDFTTATRDGYHQFSATADCYLANGSLTATIPVAGVNGGTLLRATDTFNYYLQAGDVVSAIGAAAFNCFMTEV